MIDLLLIILTILLAYIYAGYPVLLFMLAKLFSRRHHQDDKHEPSVILIISAYNEERVIGARITNAFELDYPQEKLSIMVVSDGSTDRTDDIVRSFEDRGVVLVRTPERRGKTAGLNLALSRVTSDVVVFSDANAMYDRFAVRRLVRHFADESVGYAVGYARYENTAETAAGRSEGAYWDIEVKMKEWESTFSSVVGGDGAIYAIRSHLYEPLKETDINDFVNPLQIVTKGYRGIFDAEAWCSEKPAGQFEKEFSRKVRIANRSFNGLLRVPDACNPLKVGRFALLLISHKLLRWFSPFILCSHFVIVLATGSYGIGWLLSLGFILIYGSVATLALVGWWQDRRGESSALGYIPYYFVLMNVASAVGILMRLRGKVISVWETVRVEGSKKGHASDVLPFLLFGIIIAAVIKISLWFGIDRMVFRGAAYVLILTLFYTYLGYPLLLAGLVKLKSVKIDRDERFLPDVTLLIVAYNEEREIEAKLINSLELDYPSAQLSIIVASDGSTDATNELVRTYEDRGIRLRAFTSNRGKIAALNEAMESITSEIVVFSDANVMYDRLALRKLVRNFNDPRVGAVSGKVILLNGVCSYSSSEKLYYGIEHFIQENEGETGALIGADGAMYAIRRALFSPPAIDTILDDFVISMSIARKGYLVIHEREARGFEHNVQELEGEFRRKARIIAGGFQCLLRGEVVPELSQALLLFKFISHKVLRWFSGMMIIIVFILLIQTRLTDTFPSPFLAAVLYCMVGALIVAAFAHLIPIIRKIMPINMAYYFFMLSCASLSGLYLGLTGRQKVTWRRGAA